MAASQGSTAAFDKIYRRIIRAQETIIAALRKRRRHWYAIDGVSGYGVGGAYPNLTAAFSLDGDNAAVRTGRAQRRLPKVIRVGKRRVPVEVMTVRNPRLMLADIGDPTENRKDYRVNGSGDWQMGTALQVFPAGGGTSQVGTAGCLVVQRLKGTGPKAQYVMTVRHLTMASGNDVAQWEKDRDPPPAGKLNNFVSTTGPISGNPKIDAGLIQEPSGADKTILKIGPPKVPQKVAAGMYVKKSGAATGLTYGTVLNVFAEQTFNAYGPGGVVTGQFVLNGMMPIRNACDQQPAKTGVLPSGVPNNMFAWQGDSGALVVLGLPVTGVFGNPEIDNRLATSQGADRQAIVEKYDGAAVGMLVMLTNAAVTGPDNKPVTIDVAWVQDIQLALNELKVDLA
jgi:hypothetical protein